MQEIFPNLYVGTVADYEDNKGRDDFCFVGACKEPIHRNVVGYTGKACSKDDPEYLYAQRDNLLALNLIDVKDVNYISPIIIDKAVEFIRDMLAMGKKVLVFCNQGMSRSPTIALLAIADIFSCPFETAIEKFKIICPEYAPNEGMLEYARQNWDRYR